MAVTNPTQIKQTINNFINFCFIAGVTDCEDVKVNSKKLLFGDLCYQLIKFLCHWVIA